MTKTLTVLSILVPITVPTYCAMLDLQTAVHLKVSQVSTSGPNPLQKFVREQLPFVGVLLCLERKIHFDSNWSKNQKSDNLSDCCAIMC